MSARLQKQYAGLNGLIFDLHRTETELVEQRSRQLRRIGDTARLLQTAAVEVKTMETQTLQQSLALEDGDRLARFRAIAAQLERDAGRLAELAGRSSAVPDDLSHLLSEINNTCNACHALYRDESWRFQ